MPYATAGTPFVSAPIGTLTATPSAPSVAYEAVLDEAGARPRDAMDARIITYVRNGGGKFISDPAEVGGFPALASVAAQPDRDADGLPDTWESQHGQMDPLSDLDADGYPAIEEFENGTSPKVKD